MVCDLVSGAWCLLFVILWVFMLWEFDAEGGRMFRLVEEGSGTVRECWSSQLQLPLCTLPAVCWFAFNADGRLGCGVRRVRAVRCVALCL